MSTTTIYNASFDNNGNYVVGSSSASVNVADIVQIHYSGKIRNVSSGVITSNQVTLDLKASSIDNFYTGMFFNIVSGSYEGVTSIGLGGFVKIISYNGTTKVATLGGEISFKKDDIYSIGESNNNEIKTDSSGNISGVFYVPPSVFLTGERIFRIDDRYVQYLGSSKFINYPGTEKTYAQAVFTAQGLLQKVVDVEYSPSISSAKNVISRERYNTFVVGKNYFNETPPPSPPPPSPVIDRGIPFRPIVESSSDGPGGSFSSTTQVFEDGSVLTTTVDPNGNYSYSATNATDGGGGGGVCFLTTAATQYRGLADDCYELKTLRRFRDTYMLTGDKKEDIIWYYENAPIIVKSLNMKEDAKEIYDEMWEKFILPSVKLIDENKFEEAYNIYRKGVEFALYKSK